VRHHTWQIFDETPNESSQIIGIGSGTDNPLCVAKSSYEHIHISGSTVPYVVERILQQGNELNNDRVFLPTGFQSQQLITLAGLRLGDISQYSELDVTIDGADE
jgi:ribose 5-phosphate isomerase